MDPVGEGDDICVDMRSVHYFCLLGARSVKGRGVCHLL